MQDRFKFRFWHKPTEKMVGGYGYNPYFVFGDTLDGIGTEYNPAQFEDCILMQCTGLRDKNGKLIYEGDIVKYEDEVYGLCIGKIEWDNAHYELQYYTGEKYGWFSHILCLKHIKNIEVIGNIYENPELLED